MLAAAVRRGIVIIQSRVQGTSRGSGDDARRGGSCWSVEQSKHCGRAARLGKCTGDCMLLFGTTGS